MQCLVLNYLDSESVQAALVLSQLYVVELYDKLQGSDPSRIMMQWPEDSYDSFESSGDKSIFNLYIYDWTLSCNFPLALSTVAKIITRFVIQFLDT